MRNLFDWSKLRWTGKQKRRVEMKAETRSARIIIKLLGEVLNLRKLKNPKSVKLK